MGKGLFVGLITLDFIYLIEQVPRPNQKIVALDALVAAGGPATNAAIAFSHLGGSSVLVGALGCHPMAGIVRADLDLYGVAIADLQPDYAESPPVSSILVTQGTGERAVVSLNARRLQGAAEFVSPDVLEGVSVVLIDGHQIAVSRAIAQWARLRGIPVVVDGGSWKPGLETVLGEADYVVCSANFRPPHCVTQDDVFTYLKALSIPCIAVTQGEQPIQYEQQGQRGEIPVSPIRAIDTLGAGDFFHGAFCHFILHETFTAALSNAAQIATYTCQFFGTRRWITQWKSGDRPPTQVNPLP